jgi:outer membrane protein assembly factor BamD
MAENSSKHKQLLIFAVSIALATGGCLFSSHPKIKVQKEKVAKNKPEKAQPAKTEAKNTKAAEPAKPVKAAAADDAVASAEPDKVLFDRSQLDLKKGRYTESRLSLQTLINTYPDSEYLAKAKLMVADSFYKEGGTSNFTQSIEEYKNFIVFFPFLDEAAYAQMQVGMAHYRMMEKADRDSTHAQAAEDAFQTFLLKYPTSPLVPQAEQHLRDVQEVLADSEYKVARFYFVKQDFPASAARLVEMVDRYPLYSESDEALWMLGNVYERAKQLSKNEDMKNHFADLAGKCYGRVVSDYPLSPRVPESKSRLTGMGMAVPATDASALARMQKEQMYEKTHKQNVVLKFPLGMVRSGPDVSTAAHTGTPNLNPPTDAVSATEVLKASSVGPTFSMQAPPITDPNTPTDAAPIEAVSGGKDNGSGNGGNNAGVQIIDDSQAGPTKIIPPAASQTENAVPQTEVPAASTTSGGSDPAGIQPPILAPTPVTTNVTAEPEKPSTPVTDPAPAPANPPAAASADPSNAAPASTAPQNATTSPAGTQPAAASTDKPAAASTSTPAKADTSKESTSKKKKGLKKLVPW